MSFPFGVGVGDVLAVSTLALKVYTAYKEAPNELRNISDEINSLRIMTEKGEQRLRNTTLTDTEKTQLSEILQGCENLLQDLDRW